MKYIKLIFPMMFFFLFSCASSPYLKSYEPIKTFLESENITPENNFILMSKEANSQTLRIFNRGEGKGHVVYPNEIDYTSALFNKKHWAKLYDKYSNDTIEKYWNDKDFLGYKFISEKRKELFNYTFLEKHPNVKNVIVLSEPIYYHNKKYILFMYSIDNYMFISKPQIVVVMTKVKNEWKIVEKILDYSCSGCE